MPPGIVVGIDVGNDGAISALTLRGDVVLREVMPTVTDSVSRYRKGRGKRGKKGKKRKKGRTVKVKIRRYDLPAIDRILGVIRCMHVCRVRLEKQQAMPKQGVTSTGALMRGFGQLEGLLQAYFGDRGKVWDHVSPKEWQGEMLTGAAVAPKVVGKKQKASRLGHVVASTLWPGMSLLADKGCRVPHDGVVDSLLIAEHLRRRVLLELAK